MYQLKKQPNFSDYHNLFSAKRFTCRGERICLKKLFQILDKTFEKQTTSVTLTTNTVVLRSNYSISSIGRQPFVKPDRLLSFT